MKPLPPDRKQRYRWSANWRRSYTFIRAYPNNKRRWYFWDAGNISFSRP
jgi:hypothetical protein